MPPARKTEALIPLQELDLQVHSLKVQRADRPRRLASSEEKLARARERLQALQEEIKGLKLESSKREKDVKEAEEKISKLSAQSMLAKKNDEYQAFQKEISGHKADKGRVEDGLLDLYMQVEEKGKLEKLRQEELRQLESDHAVEKKRVEGEIAALDAQIAALQSQRAAHSGAAEKEILALYERVLAAKDDGIALAAAEKYDVVEDKGKVSQWQCEGCNVGLNMQDLNLLMQGKSIQTCRNCSRILYLRPS